MLAHWPIRTKLLFGTALLTLMLAILSFSSFRGVYAYRELVRGISRRAMELEPASKLTARVGELRFSLRQAQPFADFPGESAIGESERGGDMGVNFDVSLLAVREALRGYQDALENSDSEDPFIGDKRREWETVRDVRRCLDRISQLNDENDWVLEQMNTGTMEDKLDELSSLTSELPKFLRNKMQAFRAEVRGQYRTWIGLTWTSSLLTLLVLALLVRLFYIWVFRPMRILIDGSRCVVAGNFHHRIQLKTHDEIAELADAMNAMTERFQQIRDDLDEQVKQRTKEVVRSEQLASVGFLAAGVSHEINNPLASIAWSAESLESRLHEILNSDDDLDQQQDDEEIRIVKTYLRRIQDEAFRCKGITEKLLDFSRLGDIEKQDTDLRELVQVVIDMVKHLGKNRGKLIEFDGSQHVVISANAQEIKQVVLNLITNALDSLDKSGMIRVTLDQSDQHAVLTVTDDGVGMTEEILAHLFEPFFTRRRGGQGTGLGLSITYRIVSDHGGKITASSDGPGKGSEFEVTLPLSCHEQESQRYKAA